MLRPQDDPALGTSPDGGSQRDLASVTRLLGEIAEQLSRLARVRVARARLRARRVAFLVLGGIVLAVVAGALALAGVRLFVGGLTAGMSELVDGPVWLAELWSGLLLLAGTTALLVLLRTWSERLVLRDLLRRNRRRPRE